MYFFLEHKVHHDGDDEENKNDHEDEEDMDQIKVKDEEDTYVGTCIIYPIVQIE